MNGDDPASRHLRRNRGGTGHEPGHEPGHVLYCCTVGIGKGDKKYRKTTHQSWKAFCSTLLWKLLSASLAVWKWKQREGVEDCRLPRTGPCSRSGSLLLGTEVRLARDAALKRRPSPRVWSLVFAGCRCLEFVRGSLAPWACVAAAGVSAMSLATKTQPGKRRGFHWGHCILIHSRRDCRLIQGAGQSPRTDSPKQTTQRIVSNYEQVWSRTKNVETGTSCPQILCAHQLRAGVGQTKPSRKPLTGGE